MALVTAAAFFMAALFLLFKVFQQRRVPLLPAIVVNYFAACICGSIVAPPWQAGDLSPLLPSAAGLGMLFITIFYVTGISTQQSGVAVTTVASKMSLLLTVLFAVFLYHDRPGALGWMGIGLALAGVALTAMDRDPTGSLSRAWIWPVVLFFGNAAIDILINWTQRTLITPATEAVFPTLAFAIGGTFGLVYILRTRDRSAFRMPATWIGGTVLGVLNYTALYFVVKALAHSGLASSSVYPLVNIGVILFGTGFSMLLFGERPRSMQYIGIACSLVALVLILMAAS